MALTTRDPEDVGALILDAQNSLKRLRERSQDLCETQFKDTFNGILDRAESELHREADTVLQKLSDLEVGSTLTRSGRRGRAASSDRRASLGVGADRVLKIPLYHRSARIRALRESARMKPPFTAASGAASARLAHRGRRRRPAIGRSGPVLPRIMREMESKIMNAPGHPHHRAMVEQRYALAESRDGGSSVLYDRRHALPQAVSSALVPIGGGHGHFGNALHGEAPHTEGVNTRMSARFASMSKPPYRRRCTEKAPLRHHEEPPVVADIATGDIAEVSPESGPRRTERGDNFHASGLHAAEL